MSSQHLVDSLLNLIVTAARASQFKITARDEQTLRLSLDFEGKEPAFFTATILKAPNAMELEICSAQGQSARMTFYSDTPHYITLRELFHDLLKDAASSTSLLEEVVSFLQAGLETLSVKETSAPEMCPEVETQRETVVVNSSLDGRKTFYDAVIARREVGPLEVDQGPKSAKPDPDNVSAPAPEPLLISEPAQEGTEGQPVELAPPNDHSPANEWPNEQWKQLYSRVSEMAAP